MKVGLITTIDTNIGDDLIREGICTLLPELFPGEPIEYVSVNKHEPYTVYQAGHPVHLRRLADFLPVGAAPVRKAIESLFAGTGRNRFDSCDLILQCGAPVFWPHCSTNEWALPLWRQVVGPLSSRIPVLNLAAGSCYPWRAQPDALEEGHDRDYVREILGYCRLTTARDRLAQQLCASAGTEIPLIPCSAFLSPGGHQATAGELVLINYMAGGGHDFGWQEGIDPLPWEQTVRGLVEWLRQKHRVAFLCHDRKELAFAGNIAPDLPAFLPQTPAQYFDCVSKAKFAVCNRMHASVAMAGLGIPSIAVGRDTRLLMVSELGLPVHYVEEVTLELLREETETMLAGLELERERLLAFQRQTKARYLSSLRAVL